MKKGISVSVIVFVIGIAVAGLVGYVATKEAYRSKKIEQEIDGLKQEAERVRKENNALEEKIAYFETAQFQERVAKEKLNLQKPDEQVVIVKPDIKAVAGVEVELEDAGMAESAGRQPNYLKWWDQFFKYD